MTPLHFWQSILPLVTDVLDKKETFFPIIDLRIRRLRVVFVLTILIPKVLPNLGLKDVNELQFLSVAFTNIQYPQTSRTASTFVPENDSGKMGF